MSSKHNAKQTKENIIAAAVQLFMEKGFEKTSMMDIANALGLSKGGIYHHFKSKEAIILAVKESKANSVEESLNKWTSNLDAQTAKEKLTAILEKNIADTEAHALDDVFSSQIKSADFILSLMKDAINSNAPVFAEIFKEGIQDGSITTTYPDEAAEVFFLLINIWCDPAIFQADDKKLEKRLRFVQEMMSHIGADIISDKMIIETAALLQNLYPEGKDENE